MRSRTPIVLATIASFMIVAMAAIGTATAAPPRIKFRPITFQTLDGAVAAERGILRVPESRTTGSKRRVKLAVVRFAATSEVAGFPIILLDGGPGNSGLDAAAGGRYRLIELLRRYGDVIVFDQRGVGATKPHLTCSEHMDLDPGQPLTAEGWSAGLAQPAHACAERLRDSGIDLSAYSTRENADDVNDLRAALGAERVVLWGVSYGTQLALTVMRRHPDRVERAVLHGVLGPDDYLPFPKTTDRILKRLGNLAAQAGFPDTIGALQRVLGNLDRAPAQVSIEDPLTGLPIDVVVGPYDVQFVTNFVVLGDRQLMSAWPHAVAQADAGDLSLFAQLGLALRRFEPPAMLMSIVCTTPVNERRQRKIERQEPRSIIGALPDFAEFCSGWDVEPLDDSFRDPIVSDVPTLLISGSLDSTTPSANANRIAKDLSESRKLLLLNATHSDLVLGDPRILDAVDEFMSGLEPSTKRIRLPAWTFTQ